MRTLRMPGPSLIAVGALIVSMYAVTSAHAEASDSRLSRATTRCAKLAELIACDEALSLKPDDPDLLMAEADTLVRLNRPGEAIGVYRNALRHGAKSDVINPRVATAAGRRRSLLGVCMSGDAIEALPACEAAWLPGAPDEVAVFKRRGELLKDRGQSAAALDAYLAAARLRPRDRRAAQSVIALADSTGRKDAATLTAVGNASMTLGHRGMAVRAYREALRQAPDFAAAKQGLRLTEQTAAHPADAATAPDSSVEPALPATPQSTDLGPFTNDAEQSRSN